MEKAKKRTVWEWIVRVITGYELTVISILLLVATVFFSTLEQSEVGLYTVKHRYYAADVFFVQPNLGGRDLPLILPGAYWTCAIFTLNLITGGIVKLFVLFLQKIKQEVSLEKLIGKMLIIISHMSMSALMIAGAVDYHFSTLTMLAVSESEENFIGTLEGDVVLEVSKIVDGLETDIRIVANEQIGNMILTKGQLRLLAPDVKKFFFENLPFHIEFEGWYKNSDILTDDRKESDGPKVNGKFIREDDILSESESEKINAYNRQVSPDKRKKDTNLSSCYVTVVGNDGKNSKLILSQSFTNPVIMNVGGQMYGFKFTGRKTILPFSVHLKELDVPKYQGTTNPRNYISHIEYGPRNKKKVPVHISMNEPLRYNGYTVYQAQWNPGMVDLEARLKYVKAQKEKGLPLEFADNLKLNSIFQIVSNPADKWPEYCVYVCGASLGIYFMLKLGGFMSSSFNRKEKKS
jgi:hypothetical protein